MGSMMSMGMEVLNVIPSGMVLKRGGGGWWKRDVVYIVGEESGEAYVNYILLPLQRLNSNRN